MDAPLPLTRCEVELPEGTPKPWLDDSIPGVKKYTDMYGTTLDSAFGSGNGSSKATYYTMPSSVHAELRQATDELHMMFITATKHVLKHPELWPSFGFPEKFWDHAVLSFHAGDATIFGRFDFSVTPLGIKVYEYNCDSGSCLLETNLVQGAWCRALNVPGHCAGIGGNQRLVATIGDLELGSEAILHILHDVDQEECYHATYVQGCAEKAGLKCKEVIGLEGMHFDEEGRVLDKDNVPIQRLWKSWSYDTILSEWDGSELRHSGAVRLVDVCLRSDVVVYEPLWCAITSNKALLPVLWDLFPYHKNLLRSELVLSPDLRDKGYVEKPVNGRAGANITIVAGIPSEIRTGTEIASTEGKFLSTTTVYQELFSLPRFNDNTEYVQVSTFVVGGHYAGTILRTDPTPIIRYVSDIVPLRIIDDGSGAPLDDGAVLTAEDGVDVDIDPEELESFHSSGEPDMVPVRIVSGINSDEEIATRAGKLAPFGVVLGYGPGRIPCYSSHYKSLPNLDPRNKPEDREFFRHQERISEDKTIFYGYKYQCVEYARRWLFLTYGHTFKDVGMAFQIFDMKYAERVADNKKIPFKSVPNGSNHDLPVKGSLLIWNEGGFFEKTGHVAIVVEATNEYVRVAEQNVQDTYWPTDQGWGRELPVDVDKEGGYHIHAVPKDSSEKGSIRGWMHILFE